MKTAKRRGHDVRVRKLWERKLREKLKLLIRKKKKNCGKSQRITRKQGGISCKPFCLEKEDKKIESVTAKVCRVAEGKDKIFEEMAKHYRNLAGKEGSQQRTVQEEVRGQDGEKWWTV